MVAEKGAKKNEMDDITSANDSGRDEEVLRQLLLYFFSRLTLTRLPSCEESIMLQARITIPEIAFLAIQTLAEVGTLAI